MSSVKEVLTIRKTTSVLTSPHDPSIKQSLPSRLLRSAQVIKSRLGFRMATSKMTATSTETLNIKLQNSTLSGNVYGYITGLDFKLNRPFILQADGRTGYWPSSPSTILQPLAKNCAIFLGSPGNSVTVTIPRLAGGRIWFSVGKPLEFLLNPGGNGAAAIVEPSAANPSDRNYLTSWSFAEFTFNEAELYANVSYVDFVSLLPIGLAVQGRTGRSRHVEAFPRDGMLRLVQTMEDQGRKDGKGWGKLVVRHPSTNAPLRVVSPNLVNVLFPGLFDGYYAAYVDAVWDKYRLEDLMVDTQHADWGVFRCRVDDENLLACYGVKSGEMIGRFSKPAAEDVFSCSTGPFKAPSLITEDPRTVGIVLNIGARISAAFNRGTMLANNVQPQGEKPESFYTTDPCSHYARGCHEIIPRGYAFPYDDVAPSRGEDQSGFVRDGHPVLFTVTVGA